MSEQNFPPGWGEQRVREVLAHYESQTEDEQFAEIEAAGEGPAPAKPAEHGDYEDDPLGGWGHD